MFVPSRPTRRRGVLVELHHDGTVVTAVDLSHNALPTHQSEAALPVATPVLVSTVCETVALVHKHRLALRMEAPIQLRAVLRTQANGLFRFTPVLLGLGRPKVAEWARQPSAVQPARSDLAPFADEQALFAGTTEFAEGLLDQFGIEIIPP